MLSTDELFKLHPKISRDLYNFFSDMKKFPCLFAIGSFNKKQMNFIIVEKFSDILGELKKELPIFKTSWDQKQHNTEKTYSTIVLICLEKNHSSFDETEYINNLLLDLYNIDSISWPQNKTQNLNDQNFEFYFFGNQWFPVLLHENHPSKVRQSPYFMIAFQPGQVFEYNKNYNSLFFQSMRKSIHKRIDFIFNNDRPFYLTSDSSGKNICQYAGLDRTEIDKNYEYPKLSKKT